MATKVFILSLLHVLVANATYASRRHSNQFKPNAILDLKNHYFDDDDLKMSKSTNPTSNQEFNEISNESHNFDYIADKHKITIDMDTSFIFDMDSTCENSILSVTETNMMNKNVFEDHIEYATTENDIQNIITTEESTQNIITDPKIVNQNQMYQNNRRLINLEHLRKLPVTLHAIVLNFHDDQTLENFLKAYPEFSDGLLNLELFPLLRRIAPWSSRMFQFKQEGQFPNYPIDLLFDFVYDFMQAKETVWVKEDISMEKYEIIPILENLETWKHCNKGIYVAKKLGYDPNRKEFLVFSLESHPDIEKQMRNDILELKDYTGTLWDRVEQKFQLKIKFMIKKDEMIVINEENLQYSIKFKYQRFDNGKIDENQCPLILRRKLTYGTNFEHHAKTSFNSKISFYILEFEHELEEYDFENSDDDN